MLDYVARDHQIKLTQCEITIDEGMDKLDAGISTACNLNPTRGSIDSGNVITECSEPPGDVTVSATEITDRPHAVELLHEVDKHARQLLTRLAVPRTVGVPFKFRVSGRRHLFLANDSPAKAQRRNGRRKGVYDFLFSAAPLRRCGRTSSYRSIKPLAAFSHEYFCESCLPARPRFRSSSSLLSASRRLAANASLSMAAIHPAFADTISAARFTFGLTSTGTE